MALSRATHLLYRVLLGGMISQLWLIKWKNCVLRDLCFQIVVD